MNTKKIIAAGILTTFFLSASSINTKADWFDDIDDQDLDVYTLNLDEELGFFQEFLNDEDLDANFKSILEKDLTQLRQKSAPTEEDLDNIWDQVEDYYAENLTDEDKKLMLDELKEVTTQIKDASLKSVIESKIIQAEKLNNAQFIEVIDTIWEKIPEADLLEADLLEFSAEDRREYYNELLEGIEFLESEDLKVKLKKEIDQIKDLSDADFLRKADAIWMQIDNAFYDQVTPEVKKEEIEILKEIITQAVNRDQGKEADLLKRLQEAEVEQGNTEKFFEKIDAIWQVIEEDLNLDEEGFIELESEEFEVDETYLNDLKQMVNEDIKDASVAKGLVEQVEKAKFLTGEAQEKALDRFWNEFDLAFIGQLTEVERKEYIQELIEVINIELKDSAKKAELLQQVKSAESKTGLDLIKSLDQIWESIFSQQ